MNNTNNTVIAELQLVRDMFAGDRQSRYYDTILAEASPVKISPLREVLTQEEIDIVRRCVRPQPKMCYKNATLFCECFDGAEYVEGQFSVGKMVCLDHAWNRFRGKFIDITMEIALARDPTTEDYASFMVLPGDEMLGILSEREFYGEIFKEKLFKKLYYNGNNSDNRKC